MKRDRTALVTGVTGQDGSYLAEQLLADGWHVVGAIRDLDADVARLAPGLRKAIELHTWRLDDSGSIAGALASLRPKVVFNLAARTSGTDMYLDPAGLADTNGMAVLRMLEAIRQTDLSIRFCQASSSEMFGEADESPQSETTAFRPRSPYGAAKLFAHNMVGIYRRRYGVFACSAILFNHESPRRRAGFVTQKIATGVARVKRGLQSEVRLGNLESRRDWGSASDVARAMRLMVSHAAADDYVIATGQAHTVREFCNVAFAYVDLDYRDHVKEDPEAFRPDEVIPLVGDAAKARRVLGWQPSIEFETIVHEMVDAALARLG